MAAVPPISDRHGTGFKFGPTHAIDEHDGRVKVRDRVTLDKNSVTAPDFRVSCAKTYQRRHTVLEYRAMHCGRKTRLDMCAGCNESRPAVAMRSRSRPSTAGEISINPTCRHAVSGVGAAPKQFII